MAGPAGFDLREKTAGVLAALLRAVVGRAALAAPDVPRAGEGPPGGVSSPTGVAPVKPGPCTAAGRAGTGVSTPPTHPAQPDFRVPPSLTALSRTVTSFQLPPSVTTRRQSLQQLSSASVGFDMVRFLASDGLRPTGAALGLKQLTRKNNFRRTTPGENSGEQLQVNADLRSETARSAARRH